MNICIFDANGLDVVAAMLGSRSVFILCWYAVLRRFTPDTEALSYQRIDENCRPTTAKERNLKPRATNDRRAVQDKPHSDSTMLNFKPEGVCKLKPPQSLDAAAASDPVERVCSLLDQTLAVRPCSAQERVKGVPIFRQSSSS